MDRYQPHAIEAHWQAEWQRTLAHRPDLLEAVQRAMTPAADAAIEQ